MLRLSVQCWQHNRIYHRRGVTLLELAVVLVILVTLTAILLPAILRTRAAARKLQCSANLKQFALACHQFEVAHGTFPVNPCPRRADNLSNAPPNVQIAPYLEVTQDNYYERLGTDVMDVARQSGDVTAKVLKCPEDPTANKRASNYRVCWGILPNLPFEHQGIFDLGNQMLGVGRRPADVIDGLAHTSLASERLIGKMVDGLPTHPGDIMIIDEGGYPQEYERCLAANAPPNKKLGLGPYDPRLNVPMFWNGECFYHSTYFHVFPPNYRLSDCMHSFADALTSARSFHSSGVQVAFADGRVVFVSDQVALQVWWAMSTRAGSEPDRWEGNQ